MDRTCTYENAGEMDTNESNGTGTGTCITRTMDFQIVTETEISSSQKSNDTSSSGLYSPISDFGIDSRSPQSDSPSPSTSTSAHPAITRTTSGPELEYLSTNTSSRPQATPRDGSRTTSTSSAAFEHGEQALRLNLGIPNPCFVEPENDNLNCTASSSGLYSPIGSPPDSSQIIFQTPVPVLLPKYFPTLHQSSSSRFQSPPSSSSAHLHRGHSPPLFHQIQESTPTTQNQQSNFRAWLAGRGDVEGVLRIVRSAQSISNKSATTSGGPTVNHWSTPSPAVRPQTSRTTVSSGSSSTVIGANGSIHSDVIRRRRELLEGLENPETESGLKDVVLSVVWAAGKLGAAYYSGGTSEVHLFPDISESAPDFWILKSIVKQTLPKFIIVSSRQDERMLTLLKELCGDAPSGNESVSEAERTQLFILTGREFAPDSCKQRLQALKLPNEPKSHNASEHLIYLNSVLPFHNEIMVRAAGALLKFMDKSGPELLQIDLSNGFTPVLNINISTMDDLVLVDDTAWGSLQIFSLDHHPSAIKQGTASGTKEGLSVYSLLNRCKTVQGSKFLRLQLLRPTRNIDILTRRHDVVEFCVDPTHRMFVQRTIECLKAIKSLPKLLFKLSIVHTTVKEWRDLYQTVYHCLLLGEVCSASPQSIELFREITEACKSDVLKVVSQEMMKIIDFDESLQRRRFVTKQGIDEQLDKKRQENDRLPEVMSLVAAEELTALPDFVQRCNLIYIPEVGYLLAVALWREGLELEDLLLPGLDYKFTSNGFAHYKSARTKELDIIIGDIQVAILDLETCVMLFLTETILQNSQYLVKIGTLAAELDSLLSISAVAVDNSFVRPKIIPGNQKIEIINGRHPLAEMICDFVPNSTTFEEEEKIVILIGPNASGKSVYLKQVGIIAIMALCGSFVPASSARIPTFDRICTRIHAQESISTGLSTFMIDINQMSLALRMSSENSLIIIDEFGKGTAEADGLSLLVATIDEFSERGNKCPTILLSTHFYSLLNHLKYSNRIKCQTMEFMKERDQIIYLFRLKNGSCETSFAYVTAENVGISNEIVNRSVQIESFVRRQLEAKIDPIPLRVEKKKKEDLMLSIADEFLHLDLSTVDVSAYMERIYRILAPFGEDFDVENGTSSPNLEQGINTPVERMSFVSGRTNCMTVETSERPLQHSNSQSENEFAGPSQRQPAASSEYPEPSQPSEFPAPSQRHPISSSGFPGPSQRRPTSPSEIPDPGPNQHMRRAPNTLQSPETEEQSSYFHPNTSQNSGSSRSLGRIFDNVNIEFNMD